jgi:competence protein ComEA
MDRSASPWRVLDDSTPAGVDAAPSADAGKATSVTSHRPAARLVAALAAAAALALAAFGLAASGSNGSVTVDNGAAILHGSARPSGDVSGRASAPADGDLVVDIQGAVLQPGVRHLRGGSRVADAIAAAGGYGPRVDAARAARELNLAAPLHDGDRVVIPSRDDPAGTTVGGGPASPGAAGGGGGGGAGGLVDLNHATASELDTLPGVGPVTAQKIVAAREERAFATIEELRDRKVVGSAAFEKLKDLVTVTP